ELERPELRELAIRTLRDATGKDLGFGVHDTPTARKEAIGRWKEWWASAHATIEAQTASILSGRSRPEDTPERLKAERLWEEGCALMDRKKYAEAEVRLRAATLADPTLPNAQITLGVLLALHQGKVPEGRR